MGIEADAEDCAAIKAAALDEEFGVATNIYLEAWLRHRKADALFKAYGTSHTLGVFPSWSEITVMGVLRKLRAPTGPVRTRGTRGPLLSRAGNG
jgi:hypothetical protein